MTEIQALRVSATMPKKSQLSPDIVRLVDVFVQIERRRQARLQALQRKES